MPGNFYHFYESNGIRVLSIFEILNSGYIASHILPLMAIGVLHYHIGIAWNGIAICI